MIYFQPLSLFLTQTKMDTKVLFVELYFLSEKKMFKK